MLKEELPLRELPHALCTLIIQAEETTWEFNSTPHQMGEVAKSTMPQSFIQPMELRSMVQTLILPMLQFGIPMMLV